MVIVTISAEDGFFIPARANTCRRQETGGGSKNIACRSCYFSGFPFSGRFMNNTKIPAPRERETVPLLLQNKEEP